MANPNVNRISTTLAAADVTAINNGFNSIGATLDAYVQALTPEEREDLFGAAGKNKSFADDALKQGQVVAAELPPEVQNILNNLKTDTDFLVQLEKIMNTQLLPLLQSIKDTRRLVVHERYAQALAIYKVVKLGAKLGLPGFQAAYDVLKAHFAGRGRLKDEQPVI